MPLRDILVLVLIALSWGAGNVAATHIVQDMPPIWAAIIRFFITGMLLLPFLRVPRAQIKNLLAIALFAGPLHFGFLYTAFSMTSHVGAITVGGQLWVAFATLLSVIFLREHLSRQQLGGLALAFAGVLVISFDPQIFREINALLVTICAAFCWGTSAFLARRASDIPGLTVQAWMAMLTWPLLLPYSWLTETGQWHSLGQATLITWTLMLMLVFASGVFGNVMMFQLVRKYPVTQTTPFLLLTPVFTQFLGHEFLNEQISVRTVVGTAITLGGVMVLTIANARKLRIAT